MSLRLELQQLARGGPRASGGAVLLEELDKLTPKVLRSFAESTREEAREAVLMKVLEFARAGHLPVFDSDPQARGYLATMLRNRAVDLTRRSQHEAPVAPEQEETLAAPEEEAEEGLEAEREEAFALLRRNLDLLKQQRDNPQYHDHAEWEGTFSDILAMQREELTVDDVLRARFNLSPSASKDERETARDAMNARHSRLRKMLKEAAETSVRDGVLPPADADKMLKIRKLLVRSQRGR